MLDHLMGVLRARFNQVEVVATATNAADGLQQIAAHQPDLLLLEIALPDATGFDLLNSLGGHSFAVIFMASQRDHALKAIRFSAVDYLLKPLSERQLSIALHRAAQWMRQRQLHEVQQLQLQIRQQMDDLILIMERTLNHDQAISIALANEKRSIRSKEILYCRAEGSYTHFYLSNGEHLVSAQGMYNYQELESHGFMQSSRGVMVNKAHIQSLCNDDYTHELLLVNGTRVHVSKRRVEAVKAIFNKMDKK